MIETELNEITSEIGGIKELQSYLVKVHLKELDPEAGSTSPQGHMPSGASYILNNVLTLYTSADLRMPSFMIPPPMIRYIEIVRASGGYGVMLMAFSEKIPCIKNMREAFREISSDDETIGLKEAKNFSESAPVLLIEDLELSVAENFLRTVTAGRHGSDVAEAVLTHNGKTLTEDSFLPVDHNEVTAQRLPRMR